MDNMCVEGLKITDFPEECDLQNGIKIYGEASWEPQMAVLSRYLHDKRYGLDKAQKREFCTAIYEFLKHKKDVSPLDITDEFVDKLAESPAESYLFSDFFNVPFPSPENPRFTFIDLFAGMGGFRLAMQAQGGECVFSSEWNKYAQKTYFANFDEMPFGDITKEVTKSYIPRHFDILCAGFPCQPFSIA